MKKSKTKGAPIQPQPKRSPSIGITLIALVAVAVVAVISLRQKPVRQLVVAPDAGYQRRPAGTLTFAKDIAPIIQARCASCHRPGEAAPFALSSFDDVSKHLTQIKKVTAERLMPPWLPEPGFGQFANSRRLSEIELGFLQQWIDEGGKPGDPLPSAPVSSAISNWELGEPDLIVEMAEPFKVPADGRDIYRNVVIPIPGNARRYVRGIDFHPGNAKVVHHASILFDTSGEAKRLAQKQKSSGFDGMELPETVNMVAGQILGWEPGKRPDALDENLSWPLEDNSDLVVQLHLHPSGKEELVKCAVAFYFTEKPPERTPFLIRLPQWQIDIPAGGTNYAVEQSYVLPVDVSVVRISPHAHYLAREMQSYATLPDGTKRWLLWIKNWDFNWQGTYRFAAPVPLPKGSKLAMRFTYDNSLGNPHNPSNPPRRVRQGPQTTDEMGQITLQVLTSSPQDRQTVAQDHLRKLTVDAIAHNESLLQENPNDAKAHAKIGQALLPLGQFPKAFEHLRTAIRLNPTDDKAHYDLGSLFAVNQQWAEAQNEFETVLRLNPDDYQAHGNLGSVYLNLRNPELAEQHFRAALNLNPKDAVAAKNLELLLAAKRAR